jgi:glutathione S-transferase
MTRLLVIGNRNYSSWSLRPWLALRHAGLRFEEHRVLLSRPQTKAEILRYAPSGKVPCWIDGDLIVWDSLAICETANERYLEGALWPADDDARARARAITAEMHSGFAALRSHMPMDIRSRRPDVGEAARQRQDVTADIDRIQSIWTECLQRSGGPLLFGNFTIADAFFAPVVTRFVTYGVPLTPLLAAYRDSVLVLPSMQQWTAAAHAEAEVIEY